MGGVALSGTVEHIIFRDENSGWCVLDVALQDGAGNVRVKGVLGDVAEGLRIETTGAWSSYRGEKEFRADGFRIYAPNTGDGVRRFLKSGAVKGVGKHLADEIVQALGANAIEVILSEPWRLRGIDGLGDKRAKAVQAGIAEYKGRLDAMLFLHERFGPQRADKLYSQYGDKAPDLIAQNPYRLVSEVEGIGFETADRLAAGVGFKKSATERVRAGVLHVIGEAARRGHTAQRTEALTQGAADLIGVDILRVSQELGEMVDDATLIMRQTQGGVLFALPRLSRAEDRIASDLRRIIDGDSSIPEIDPNKALDWVSRKLDTPLSTEQCEAVATVIRSKVSVIRGGPGTGKTTVLNALLRIVHAKNVTTRLCAPTGLAARRMTAATGQEAQTYHRLLDYDPRSQRFNHHEHNPLPVGLIVADETSMTDSRLMASLLRAMPRRSHLVLIGDSDQLPSVGAGCVLRDIINSGLVPVATLTRTFRQAEGSEIIEVARSVNEGRMPNLKGGGDVTFHSHRQSADAMQRIVNEVVGPIRAAGFDPRRDVQVIVPKNRGPLSVEASNLQLQAALNPNPRTFFKRGSVRFGVQDKVMQVVNDPEREVSNGDIGIIEWVANNGREARVRYDDRLVGYQGPELGQLSLAYGVTCHKSQGSEFPCVLMGVDRASHILLDRTLLYTGITRAKKRLALVGDHGAIWSAVQRDESLRRVTLLGALLKEADS
ncbi:MAG: ATP-dependent RecD-like DNA helicase [Salinisphaeraceae bacterium]